MNIPIDSSTQYPAFLGDRAALSNCYPNACVPSREAVCTIFMVFGMICSGREPATYHMRGGHVNHEANSTQYTDLFESQCYLVNEVLLLSLITCQ